jgi:hypothetical protein
MNLKNIQRLYIESISIILLSLFSLSLRAQPNKDFSLAFSKEVHDSFDYQIGYWTAGGDLTRYVYLNMTEFWRHSFKIEFEVPRSRR